MALVIKRWTASGTPDENGEYVRVHGREAGLVSFVLSLVGVDPVTRLCVDANCIRFEQGSLAGFARKVTPLTKVASASHGYFKPWKKTLIIFAVGLALLAVPVVGWVIGPLLLLFAPVFYFLNEQLFIGGNDSGAVPWRIEFKRSVIEGKNIDVKAAEQIVSIIEMLLLGLPRPRAPLTVAQAVLSASQIPEGAGAGLELLAERAREGVDKAKAQVASVRERVAHGAGATASAGIPLPAAAAATPASKCPGCGGVIAPSDRFCGVCGISLA